MQKYTIKIGNELKTRANVFLGKWITSTAIPKIVRRGVVGGELRQTIEAKVMTAVILLKWEKDHTTVYENVR